MSIIAHSLRNCSGIAEARNLHAQTIASGITGFTANLLIQAYGRCGSPEEARMVFDSEIQERNLFSWNIMIQAYAKNGYDVQAMDLFHRMRQRDVITWTSMISLCASRGNKSGEYDFFSRIPQTNAVTWNVLLASNTDDCFIAKGLFDSMPARTIISWNTMLRVVPDPCLLSEIFRKMPACDGVSWDLSACGSHSPKHWFDNNPARSHVSWNILQARMNRLEDSKFVYDKMPSHGVLSCTAMIQAYSLNGEVDRAKLVFDSMNARSLVTWNTMIPGFSQASRIAQAQSVFDRAPQRDVISWTCMFQALASSGAHAEAKAAFDEMPEKNVVSWTGLLQLYSCDESPDSAKAAFDRMPKHDLAGWNALVAAYARNGHIDIARQVFEVMMPEKGLWSCSCLIDAYARHGRLQEAEEVFGDCHARDAASWNSMMEAYASNGHCALAIHLFREMQLIGTIPDAISFTTVLAACSHLGTPEDAQNYLVSMQTDYGLEPDRDHYVCIVDSLGRTGRLGNAEELVASLPSFGGLGGDNSPWKTLLGACRNHGDLERGRQVGMHALELDPQWPSLYSLLSNLAMESL